MLFVVSYDIEDDKSRTRLSKLLLDYGDRVQFSVFQVEAEREEMSNLIRKCAAHIGNSDSIRIYPICATCESSIQVLGQDTAPGDVDHAIL